MSVATIVMIATRDPVLAHALLIDEPRFCTQNPTKTTIKYVGATYFMMNLKTGGSWIDAPLWISRHPRSMPNTHEKYMICTPAITKIRNVPTQKSTVLQNPPPCVNQSVRTA